MIAERDVRPDAAAADVAVNGSLPRPPILMSAGLADGWTIATRFILGGSSACAAKWPAPRRVRAEPLRHRQTKEAATDMFSLKPPRHIPTLPFASI